VLILAALPLTGSRAGGAATGVGLLVLVGAIVVGRRPPEERRRVAATTGLTIAAMGAAAAGLTYGLGPGIDGTDDRLRVYAITLGIVADRPWLGIGLGGFPAQFAMARPTTVAQVWTEAHNGYLELAAELGIPAAVAFVTALGWLVAICANGALVRRRDGIFPALGLAASILLGGHALVDFSPQIPAIAATWAALLGIGVAQAWRREA
jgi:O-antigen ligase